MIVFAHLLNDRSGSPKVLSAAIDALTRDKSDGLLYVGSDGAGCLDENSIPIVRYWYRRSRFRLITFFTYFFSQLLLFFSLLFSRHISKNAVIYVNTLLPFGAALYGVLTKRPVVYHLHEVSVSPAPLRWFLVLIARLTAVRLIYVSRFHRACLPIGAVPATTIYNALSESFMRQAKSFAYSPRKDGRFCVLMLASLRDYKGIPEFVSLAERFVNVKDVDFCLVANEVKLQVDQYFGGRMLPINLRIFPRSSNPSGFYENASVVVNLSRPDMCQETFGLTLLEAMAFGIPVIAPPVGGPAELIEHECQGYLVDSRKIDVLYDVILSLSSCDELCMRISKSARQRSEEFSEKNFTLKLKEALDGLM